MRKITVLLTLMVLLTASLSTPVHAARYLPPIFVKTAAANDYDHTFNVLEAGKLIKIAVGGTAALAPDNSVMAVTKDNHIFIYHLQGSTQVDKIVEYVFGEFGGNWPVWSNDSQHIAFECSGRPDYKYHTCVVNRDGTGLKQLDVPGFDLAIPWAWYDSSTLMVVVANEDKNKQAVWNLYQYKISTKAMTPLTKVTADEDVYGLDITPSDAQFQGRMGFYLYNKSTKSSNIYVTGVYSLADDGGPALAIKGGWGMSWSPNGDRFSYVPDSGGAVWIANADGTGAHEIWHQDNAQISGTEWRSNRIFFTLHVGNDASIVSIQDDGTDLFTSLEKQQFNGWDIPRR